jgi:hypothetical protein
MLTVHAVSKRNPTTWLDELHQAVVEPRGKDFLFTHNEGMDTSCYSPWLIR